MSRLSNYLRRGFLAVAAAGSLGFGASQALASPQAEAGRASCPAKGYDYAYAACRTGCAVGGYCSAGGTCQCGFIP